MKPTSFLILTGAVSPAVYTFFGHLDPAMGIFAATTLIGFVGVLLQLRGARKAAEFSAKQAELQREADKAMAEQHRQWDLEDRAASAKALATKVGLDAEEVKRLIAENTDISRKAFKEANNVNGKVESLGETLVKRRAVRKRAK